MDRIEKAVDYKHSGFNCCQAVVRALADLAETDGETLNIIASGFAVGMGCMEATLCKDLKGRDTGIVLCECDDCVRNAVRAFEEVSAKQSVPC